MTYSVPVELELDSLMEYLAKNLSEEELYSFVMSLIVTRSNFNLAVNLNHALADWCEENEHLDDDEEEGINIH